MTIEKLPSGSYRATVMENGKRYRKTFDHKPTQKEVMQALAEEMKEQPKKGELSFKEAAEKYCESKRNVLSPKTIREYILLYKRLPEWLLKMNIYDIDQVAINHFINELAIDKSAKTIKNMHGFVTSVLKTFRPDMAINTSLPQRKKEEPYIPSVEEVKLMLKHMKGTEYEVPFILASFGMRRSEICALQISDIEGTTVHINKALVQNDKNEWVVKSTKTKESTRDIIIPQYVVDMIMKHGYVYNGFPNNISRYMSKLEEQLGIPHFSMHKLRHYFASRMSALGVPEADILHMGGWQSDEVMKTVYRHSMIDKDKDAKQSASDKLSNELFS